MNLASRLRGTGVAIITPFTNDSSIDYTNLKSLLDWQIANGVNYIVVLGTTGETPVLSQNEKIELIHFVAEQVNKRVPVVVGVGGNNTRAVIQDLKTLPLQEADAVLSASPYYNKPSQEGIYQHYAALAAESPKPILLYNVPGRTAKNMTSETILRLATLPNIAGVKEASGDMQQCMEILRDCPQDFLVVSGDDALALPQLACGMQGVISVIANCYPKEFSDLVNACLQKDFATGKKINDALLPAYTLLFSENNPAGVKAFLSEMGRIQNELRLPLVPASMGLQNEIKTFCKNFLTNT